MQYRVSSAMDRRYFLERIMARYKIAHVREQGVDLIIIPLESSFGNQGTQAQNDTIAVLQLKARAAGLAGKVVPVWRVRPKVQLPLRYLKTLWHVERLLDTLSEEPVNRICSSTANQERTIKRMRCIKRSRPFAAPWIITR